MKTITGILTLIILTACLSGCGETFDGIGEDSSRMWRGAKTIVGAES